METIGEHRFSISKEEFLENFVHLFESLKDYQELLTKIDDEELDPIAIKSLIHEKTNNLKFGGVNVRVMELIGIYLRFSLEKFNGSNLQFLVPNEPDDGFFKLNDGLESLSTDLHKYQKELNLIEEKIYFLTRILPPQNVQKVRLVLRTISGFFKSIIRQDHADMITQISHLHHLSANKDSFYLINEIGYMVRGIHDSLKDFSDGVPVDSIDPSLVDDMPDAIDKLNLVIQRMESATNSTLDDIEDLLEKNSNDQTNNIELIENCNDIAKELDNLANENPELQGKLTPIIEKLNNKVVGNLNNYKETLKGYEAIYFRVIGNQSFQDITGQTLKKIIGFIEHLEFNLLNILQKYSSAVGETSQPPAQKPKEEELSPLVGKTTADGLVLEGPQDNKPTDKKESQAKKQTDVDDILAQFGF